MRKPYTSPAVSVLFIAPASHMLAGSNNMNISGGGKQTGARAPAKPF